MKKHWCNGKIRSLPHNWRYCPYCGIRNLGTGEGVHDVALDVESEQPMGVEVNPHYPEMPKYSDWTFEELYLEMKRRKIL